MGGDLFCVHLCVTALVGEVLENQTAENRSPSPEEFVVTTLQVTVCSHSGGTAVLSQMWVPISDSSLCTPYVTPLNPCFLICKLRTLSLLVPEW